MPVDLIRLQEGVKLAKEGLIDPALEVFEELNLQSPDSPDILFFVGACNFKKGAHEAARRNWERVLELQPGHQKAQSMLAQLPPAEESWDSGFGGASLPGAGVASAQPVAKEKPIVQESAPSKAARGKSSTRSVWVVWGPLAVVLLVIGLFAFDMLSHPESYPFLGKKSPPSSTPAGDPSGASVAPPPLPPDEAPQEISLESGLAGRWFFRWEGKDPATLSFQPNGKLTVLRNLADGSRMSLEGDYRVEGTTLIFNLGIPDESGAKNIEEVRMFNAKIVGTELRFNFLAPDGPTTLAVKQ